MKTFQLFFGAIILASIITFFIVYFTIKPGTINISNTDWAGTFISFASVLVALLLIFNFVYVKEIKKICDEAEKDLPDLKERFQKIEPDLEAIKDRLTEIDFILKNNLNNKKILNEETEHLIMLNSENDIDTRRIALEWFKIYGKEIHLLRLEKEKNNPVNNAIRDSIIEAIGCIKGRRT